MLWSRDTPRTVSSPTSNSLDLDVFIAAREVAFGLWFVGTARVNPRFRDNLDSELAAIRRSLDSLGVSG